MNRDKIQAVRSAREWLKQKPLYLDTETTGLRGRDEIIDLALIDSDGTVLIDTLVRPTVPISNEAEAIHRISNEMVVGAPSFSEIMYNLIILSQERSVIIYNAEFDRRIIQQSAEAHKLEPPAIYVHCAMVLYAKFHGEWNHRRSNYKRQSQAKAAQQLGLDLPADLLHRAKADAELCRLIVEEMAATPLPGEDGYQR